MTGSSVAAIVIPIVVMLSLAAWIAMVFHAASHPFWDEPHRARNAIWAAAVRAVGGAGGWRRHHDGAVPTTAPARRRPPRPPRRRLARS